MTKYRIVKTKPKTIGEYILLHPPIEGDEIYEFNSLEEAKLCLTKLSNDDRYKGIILKICEIFYLDSEK